MGTPVATATDLELFMNLTPGTINVDRATQILGLAQDLCESVVSPLPMSARVVVLSVAARGFSNPEQVLTETVGPYTVQRGAAALFLAKSDMAMLRRSSGRGGAFSIETLAAGVSAVQLVTIFGGPTGGTFTLGLYGQNTAPLAFNSPAATLQAALEGLSVIQAGNVLVTGTGPYTISFRNDLATTPVPLMAGDGSALTGGTSPTVVVSVLTAGVYAPGQGLAPWDYDFLNSHRQTPIGG